MTVTEKDVVENMQEVLCRTVVEFGKPTTYVTVKMKNGFTVRESTTCVDPKNYSEETGKKICLEKIKQKIYFLLGYTLQEKISRTTIAKPDPFEMDKQEKEKKEKWLSYHVSVPNRFKFSGLSEQDAIRVQSVFGGSIVQENKKTNQQPEHDKKENGFSDGFKEFLRDGLSGKVDGNINGSLSLSKDEIIELDKLIARHQFDNSKWTSGRAFEQSRIISAPPFSGYVIMYL